ncbi:MAG: PDZ domain-containing protein [Gammaproteobacteria bacterium]|nr:PDZ domain-containing protein [Gammaproteobacteria bacterium]MDP2141636.1 PDZ domain-containing protein [Gammaproteobacteria bacterium]MDP2346357.1 PDZ domain-containing protein [Gammaproteobacteria bacterium]
MRLRFAGLLVACLLSACVSREPRQLVPSITLSPETVSLSEGERVGSGLNFGMTTAINESDSLTNIAILPGVRVRAVTPNGAADVAGIRAGDVILSIDGREINQPDLLDALAQQVGSDGSFVFQVRRNTTVFETTVNARMISDERSVPIELYRVDPIATRAGYTTEVYEAPGAQAVSGARIVQFFAQSPLPAANLRVGDTILALDGEPIRSAQHFITRIHTEHQLGDSVRLSVVRAADVTNGGIQNQLLEVSVPLWDPGRRVSRLSLWPLVRYESSLAPQQTRLTIGDLWLFSLFNYQHVEGEKEFSLFSLFRFATGYGELLEETAP